MPKNYVEEISKRDDRILEIEARVGEIQKRLLEIKSQLATADEKVIEDLRAEAEAKGKEQTSLEDEEKRMKDEKVSLLKEKDEEARRALESSDAKILAGKDSKMEQEEINKALEQRAADWKAGKAVAIDNMTVRSTLLSGGTLATPTAVKGINDEPASFGVLNSVSVDTFTGYGEVDVAYVKTHSTAAKGVEGTAATESDPDFGTVAIKPYMVNTVSYVSKHIYEETPINYQAKVQELALRALRAKVTDLIVNGDGTNFYGIVNAVDKAAAKMYAEVSVTAIDATTLRKIVLGAVGDADEIPGNCALILSKAVLAKFGDIRGTNEKKAIYDITVNPDGNTGMIKDGGLAVPFIVTSKLADTKMIYGKLPAYDLGLFGNYTVSISKDEKFSQGLVSILGEANVGGNITYANALAVITIGA